jgi:hypothetical protein
MTLCLKTRCPRRVFDVGNGGEQAGFFHIFGAKVVNQ